MPLGNVRFTTGGDFLALVSGGAILGKGNEGKHDTVLL
jgi:hypothetical protein